MPQPSPFNFTEAMHALLADIAAACEELRHVDMSRVAVVFSQARHRALHGVFARIHPLRFAGGEPTAKLRGHTYRMPRVAVDGREMLYVIGFTLPRFMDLPFEEKMTAIIHELYHISPRFDGDLRRFGGSKPYHTGSQRRYDAAMARIARGYLESTSKPELQAFLRQSFRELAGAAGGVVGVRIRNLNPRRID